MAGDKIACPTPKTLRRLRRLAANDSVDHRDQSVHALIGPLGGFRESIHALSLLIHSLGELIDTVREHNLRGQQLPVFVAEGKAILDQQLHQSLHAIQPGFAVSVGAFFRHGSKLLSQVDLAP